MSQFNFTALPEWAITTDEPSPVEDIAFTPMEVLPAETKVEDPEIHPGMTKFVKHVRGQVESAMTLSEKIKRDAFVAQYVIDCNGRAAVQRAFGNEYEYKAADYGDYPLPPTPSACHPVASVHADVARGEQSPQCWICSRGGDRPLWKDAWDGR
jgi:hypothetical protein